MGLDVTPETGQHLDHLVEGVHIHANVDGYKVGTVKHTSHAHQFDTTGKDSYRHQQAGAGISIALSQRNVAVFAGSECLNIKDIQALVAGQFDIWLVEGDRNADRPKILVTRDLEQFTDSIPGNVVATIGPKRLDHIARHYELSDYRGLASFIIGTVMDQRTGKNKQ